MHLWELWDLILYLSLLELESHGTRHHIFIQMPFLHQVSTTQTGQKHTVDRWHQIKLGFLSSGLDLLHPGIILNL